MSELASMSVDEGTLKAITILLDEGYKSKYYSDWKEAFKHYCIEGLEDESNPLEYSELWELFDSIAKGVIFKQNGLSASLVATQSDGEYASSSTYFVVVSLSDGEITRYFKRNGWYNSFEGGNLTEGENSEVFPQQKSVIIWKESN
jgi:flagellar basal body rod protein FlgG